MTKRVVKVIIAGGRKFSNYKLLKEKSDFYLSDAVTKGYKIVIVSGTAKGADKLGERYAKEKGYEIAYFPADWENEGKRAGYLRNEQMAKFADALIAFHDGDSRGTKHMIDLASKHDLYIRVVNY